MLSLVAALAVGANPPWNNATGACYGPFPWDETTGTTMNGDYLFGTGSGGSVKTHRGTHYFEVVTPSYFSTYAEVRWDSFQVPLNDDVIAQTAGKMVNFVGYEFDLVRTLPNGTHVSVPAWELYNHHFGNSIIGKAAKLVKTGVPGDHEGAHADGPMTDAALFPGYRFVNAETPATEKSPLRSAAASTSNGGLIIGNGAESRKTFHYFTKGYGVQVASPAAAGIHPMIIDTRNREGTGTASRPTGHGVVPPESNVPSSAMYSGIHECPCTDQWPKKISSFSTLKAGTCNPLITSADKCFAAAGELGLNPVVKNSSTASALVPAGCSVQPVVGGYELIYNTNPKPSVTCGKPSSGGKATGTPLAAACNITGQWMNIANKGIYDFVPAGAAKYNVMSVGKLAATVTESAPSSAAPQGGGVGQWGKSAIQFSLLNYTAPNSPVCTQMSWGNGVTFVKMPYANEKPVPPVLPRVSALAEDLINISVDIDPAKDLVTLTLKGPSEVWFGAGFGYHHVSTGGADPSVGVSMIGTNWTIVVLGDGTVMERKLGNHEAGTELPLTVNVTSNTVVDGVRTVVMTRTIAGVATDDFFFDPSANQLTFINAIGNGPYLMEHKVKSSGVLYFVELDYPTCICDIAADQGSIGAYSWGTQRCVARPLGQMLDDPGWESNHRVNPSCDIHAYKGGLRCCKGGTIILDTDQMNNISNNFVFEWQLKYRYYYEILDDTTKAENTFMTSWWTEHNNGEHDVPPCNSTNPEDCTYTITSNFTAGDMGGCSNGCQFITMEGHCHIGCIGMEMWIVDDPKNPKLLCNASVNMGQSDSWMDEEGYIAGANTCIFGPGAADIVPLHPMTKLMSVKVSNTTNQYTGDMGLWEINAAPLPADYKFADEE